MPNNLLELAGVTRSYREGGGTRRVLTGVDLALRRGEVVAITGRSGSGKSTLLNLVSGIDLPDAGRIVLDGVELTALAERERTRLRRRHVGFVFQFFNLVPTLTVLENLLLPLELNGYERGAALERARAVLASVGLDARAGDFPDRLSGGEQQRVALGRALVHRPVLVLADEPTGNLDADTGREVLRLVRALVDDGSRLVLMATHSAEAAASADRVLHLEGGRLHDTAGPDRAATA